MKIKSCFITFLLCLIVSVATASNSKSDSLLTIWKDVSKHDTVRAKAMHVFSRGLVFNNPDSALLLSNQLLKFCRQKNLSKYEIGAINNIAISYYAKGEYEKSIDNYGQSVSLLKEMIYGQDTTNRNFGKALLGKTYSNIGNVYLDKGDYPRALDFYFQSLKLVEEAGDLKAQSVSNTNIGIIYGIQKNYITSINYFLKSLANDSILGDKMGVASNYSNIGNLYQESGELFSSLTYQLKSLEIRRVINDKDGVSLSLASLGSLYQEFGKRSEQRNEKAEAEMNFKTAISYYQDAIKNSKMLGDKNTEASALSGLGNCYLQLNDAHNGLTNCEQSLKIAEAIQATSGVRDACECLYNAYNKMNKKAEALVYFEKYIAIRDTLNSVEKIREIAQKQFEFDYNKKAAADSLKTIEQRLLIQAELKNEQTRRYFLYGGLFLVIVFAGFMYNRYKISQQQKRIIEVQKIEVETKQKEIVDSIQYAKRIQKTLLAHDSVLNEYLKSYFVLYKPKDIVSGDFYWATHIKTTVAGSYSDLFFLAVCDSTGHGVPGAFMSLLNSSLLNEAITEKNITDPAEVLNYVRSKLIANMAEEGQKDGMDGVLVCFDKTNKTIKYAAANNKPLLINSSGATELPSNKMPIGQGERRDSFETFTITYSEGDMLYLYTDGYADQFGGEKGKKFKYKQLEALLVQIHSEELSDQKNILNDSFEKWRGKLEQVDDVCMVGIKL